jgi:acyl transferase domain-containing protein
MCAGLWTVKKRTMQMEQNPWYEKSHSGKPRLVFLFAYRVSEQILREDTSLMNEPAFRQVIEECNQILSQLSFKPVFAYPLAALVESEREQSAQAIAQCAFQLALAALWCSWGVVPDAVMGEGVGEIAAACLAGKLSLREALLSLYYDPAVLVIKSCARSAGRAEKTSILPFYSTMIGRCEDLEELIVHWRTHSGRADLSSEAFEQLCAQDYDAFLEIGPPTAALGVIFVSLQRAGRKGLLLSSCNERKESRASLLPALQRLVALGYPVDLLSFSLGAAREAG